MAFRKKRHVCGWLVGWSSGPIGWNVWNEIKYAKKNKNKEGTSDEMINFSGYIIIRMASNIDCIFILNLKFFFKFHIK